jgi:hypothetical protein
MRLRRVWRGLRRFAQVGNRRRLLSVEATVWLFLARMALLVVPFPRIARHLGEFVAPTDARARQLPTYVSPEHILLAKEIGWAVTRAARYLPFEAVCLPQAIAARTMLRRRGIGSVLHFGVATLKDADRHLHAHAWLDAGGIEITGYPVAGEFTEVASFV